MAAGLAPGMPLADALSFVPDLATAMAEPARDAAALRRLAEWCGRYSPWTAPDGVDGIKIELTGCAHLWGGEKALATDLVTRLGHRGIAARVAVAGTLGAAWALARYGETGSGPLILLPAQARSVLTPLPVEALRLDPATAQRLRRVGLKRVGDLYLMPRAAVAHRFGEAVARRLDQALDDLPEPLSPLGETPARRVRLSFAEPITEPADLALAAERLALDLVTRLAREGVGARRLVLAFHRIDSCVERIALGTAKPSRDPHHLAALFQERLDTIDPGLGVEDMILGAFAVEPLSPEQIGFAGLSQNTGMGDVTGLLDRLGNRLGLAAVARIETRQSHIPERASVTLPVSAPAGSGLSQKAAGTKEMRPKTMPGPDPGIHLLPARVAERGKDMDSRDRPGHDIRVHSALFDKKTARTNRDFPADAGIKPPRPIRLFDPPEPVEAAWLLPDDPPFRFTWRRRAYRVISADGPERIAAEWWRPAIPETADTIRDYYRVEDQEGRRFWLFRAGLPDDERPPRWFVHGVFA
jgi:protein ImuB